MASKYDGFWLTRLEQIGALVHDAARGSSAMADFSEIRPLGERASWAGSVSVSGAVVVRSAMAHMVSLGRVVADAGLCVPWPDETFVFTMSPSGSLTVRIRSAPSPHRSPIPVTTERVRVVAASRPTLAGEVDPADACTQIHATVAALPRYTDPGEVPFANGLYFFFEAGEESPHGHPRITRIGNHPRAQGRLVGRLRDHYATRRDAKNGSVFRRYLGGSLLRRDGQTPCLEPSPGKGHWEQGNAHECDACGPYEALVTARLRSHFTFACVRIDDPGLRNHLEGRLIASVARCQVCEPSGEWLGRFAYPEKVRTSGMWNSEFVDGPAGDTVDLTELRRLAAASRPSGADLSDTLLLIPCSAGKRGTNDRGLRTAAMDAFLGEQARRMLGEGRALAFQRAGIDRASALVPALLRYSGQPYKTPGVLDAILDAISRGLHVVIVSGGYGLLRAEEPIHDYEAPMQKTLSVWRSRIQEILRDYVSRNDIRRTFGAYSTIYSAAIPDRLTGEDWRAVPRLDELDGGFGMKVVPERVAQVTLDLLERDLIAGDGWTRSA
jgi:hypothetical protein